MPQPLYIYIAYENSMNNNRHQISCGMSAFTLNIIGIMTELKLILSCGIKSLTHGDRSIDGI